MSIISEDKIKRDLSKNRLSKPKLKSNWYILYSAPRAEKKAKQELENRGYDVFLPIVKTLRIWKNRQRKIVDQVLFPCYVFVYTTESKLYKICQVPKITTFVRCGRKPSIINVECIESIKRMLDLNQKISVEPNFYKGENVRIIDGPLAGYEGILVKEKSKTRFGIQLKEIEHTVLIDICTSIIEKK